MLVGDDAHIVPMRPQDTHFLFYFRRERFVAQKLIIFYEYVNITDRYSFTLFLIEENI